MILGWLFQLSFYLKMCIHSESLCISIEIKSVSLFKTSFQFPDGKKEIDWSKD